MDRSKIARIHSVDDIYTISDTINTLYFNKDVDFTPLCDFTWSSFPNIKKVFIHLDRDKLDFSGFILPETTEEISFYFDKDNGYSGSLIYPEKVKSIFIFVRHDLVKEMNKTKELDIFISGFPSSLEYLRLEITAEKGSLRADFFGIVDLNIDVLFFPTCIQKIYIGKYIKIDHCNLPPIIKYYYEDNCDLDKAKIIHEKLQDKAEIYFDCNKYYRGERGENSGKQHYGKVKIEKLRAIFGDIHII